MEEPTRIELIERYLSDRASDEELKLVQELQEQNEAFARELTFMKSLQTELENLGIEELKEKIVSVDASLEASGFFTESVESNARSISLVWFASAAAAVVVVLCLAAYWFFSGPVEPETLFSEHFHPKEDLISLRLDESGFASPVHSQELKESMIYYDKGNYEEAMIVFDSYVSQAPQDDFFLPYVRFYQTQIWLREGEIEDAIEVLEKLEGLEEFELQADVAWYLSLAYMRIGEWEASKRKLEKLKENEIYHTQATQLLRKL